MIGSFTRETQSNDFRMVYGLNFVILIQIDISQYHTLILGIRAMTDFHIYK